MSPTIKTLRARARDMRKNPTREEAILWGRLRRRQLLNCRFRRQHVLMPYIVDFFCHPLKIAVEVDGGVHENSESAKSDNKRDKYLREVHGVQVIRFSTEEVRQQLDEVLETISTHLARALSSNTTAVR